MTLDRRKALSLCGCVLSITLLPMGARANRDNHGPSEDVIHSKLEALAHGQLRIIAREPILIDAVSRQNRETRTYTADHIARLDGDWRREVYAKDTRNLIPTVMETPASHYLKRVAELSSGLYTEFILMDARGLNVALSSLTPDYWQGGEGKFTQTYVEGLRGLYIGEPEHNPLLDIWQRRVSITVADPRSLIPLGALCAGVNLAKI